MLLPVRRYLITILFIFQQRESTRCWYIMSYAGQRQRKQYMVSTDHFEICYLSSYNFLVFLTYQNHIQSV